MLRRKDKDNKDNLEKNMGILDHLDELRDRIIYSAIFLVLGCVIAIFISRPVIGILFRPFERVEYRREEKVLPVRIQEDGALKIVSTDPEGKIPVIDLANRESFAETSPHRLHIYLPDTPYNPEEPEETPPDLIFGNTSKKPVFFSPADPILLWLKTTVFLGLLIAFPLILYQVWLFVNPGMKDHEKKTVIPILLLGAVLFPCGATFAYFAFGMILDFLLNVQILNMEPMLNAWNFLNIELKLMIGFGIAFEMPIAIMFLTLLGIVDPPRLRKWRPYSILAIAFLSMMLTPPDPLSMVIMMFPLFFLYEVSILLAVPIARKRLRKEEEERLEEEEEDRRIAEAEAARKEKEKAAAGTEDISSDADTDKEEGDEHNNEEDYYDGYDDDYGYDYEASQAEAKRKELDKKRWKKKKLRRSYRDAKVTKGKGTRARSKPKT